MQSLPQDLKNFGVTNTVFGIYGYGQTPQLVFFAVQGPPMSADIRTGYASYASGVRTNGFVVDTAAATVTAVDGINFICSPVTEPAPASTKLSACLWMDGDVAGSVINLTSQPVPETLNLAVQARVASEH
jgi:hypothetical protein